MKSFRLFAIALVALFYASSAQGGVLLRLFYDLVPGGGMDRLRRSPMFPDHPTRYEVLTRTLDVAESAGGELNGDLMRGFIEAPQTGDYTFWITSDDAGELWLSTDEEPRNIRLLVRSGVVLLLDLANPTQRAWPIAPNSEPVFLEKGRKYYFEVLHKENGGADHVAVGWQLPDGTFERPIQLVHVSPFPLNEPVPGTSLNPFWLNPFPLGNPYGGINDVLNLIANPFPVALPFPLQNPFQPPLPDPFDPQQVPAGVETLFPLSPGYTPRQTAPLILTNFFGYPINGQPTNQVVKEGDRARFSVTYEASQPASLQWRSNGIPIQGANLCYLEIDHAAASIPPATYDLVISNALGAVTSAPAALVVAPASLFTARTSGNTNGVDIRFAFAVQSNAALNPQNYSITNGSGSAVAVKAVSYLGENLFRVSTDPLPDGTIYSMTIRNITAAGAPLSLPSSLTGSFLQVHGVAQENFFGQIQGITLDALQTDSRFAAKLPDRISYNSFLEASPNREINFGRQFIACLTAPTNGNYVFAISSADEGQLYVSTDESPDHKALVAFDPVVFNQLPKAPGLNAELAFRNGFREYAVGSGNPASRISQANPASPLNYSPPIPLQAGKKYYLEVLTKSGDGSNNLSVAWQKPGDPRIANGAVPIGPEFLSVPGKSLGPVAVIQHPASTQVSEVAPASFQVRVDGAPPYRFQWIRNGAPLPGATGDVLNLPACSRTNNQDRYSVIISNVFSAATSAVATLTVAYDAEPPRPTSATGSPDLEHLTLSFSEPIAAASISDFASAFQIQRLTVTGASLSDSGDRVVLSTSPQTPGEHYLVSLSRVTDRAAIPNPIAPNSTISFQACQLLSGTLRAEYFFESFGSSINDLETNPNYPVFPDEVQYWNSFQLPASSNSNYGVRVSGFFTPPADGDYLFYLRSRDASELLLSTDDSPANGLVIAQEPECCHPFQENGDQRSAAIRLAAGGRYYIEARLKVSEGPGDLAVAVRLPGNATPASQLTPIAAAQISTFGDPSGIPPSSGPLLTIVRSGIDLVVRWPDEVSGFSLQTAGQPSGPWIDFGEPAGSHSVQISSGNRAAQFFRLIRH